MADEPLDQQQTAGDVQQPNAPAAPLLQQFDQLARFVIRELPAQLMEGLQRNFPQTADALPAARWRQLGWVLLGLAGVSWLVNLGPEMAQSLVWLGGIGVGGYAGWHILAHHRQLRRDETAQRFGTLTARLGAESAEERIAALAQLDQLAYDHPRYRPPLVALLSAWLPGRSGGHDTVIAATMLAEFRELLADEDQPERVPVAQRTVEPAPAAAPPALEIVPVEQVPAPIELPAAQVEASGAADEQAGQPQRAASGE